ncbi:cytochrome b [Nitratireductor sp. ZSWI3]|uniref:cytochrome b n=1 Tax=Nitratireductor sp. ZSWI3 TaxID=2966359 RepID=UPI002150288D|nr:cytochrome b/b6 domain-containing protein [Nitratireductor sp. ZSWI3]MCR4268170.1 cytochrome b/b6 domain-containing protein [Nitratireductor sp. ZSWI3]
MPGRKHISPRHSPPGAYGLTAIIFHWLVGLLFLVQIPLGYLTQAVASRPALQFDLYQWHKSVGFLILALALLRLAWRLLTKSPAPPEGLPHWELAAARLAQALLLLLTVVVPLTGWLIASTSPLRIPSYVFNLVVVPHLPLTPSQDADRLWSSLHAYLAYAAGLLALVHIGAALWHHFLLRDETLSRMLPPAGSHRRTR